VIPKIDPREIGSAFHPSTIVPTYPSTICRSYGTGGAGRAGAEIAEKGNLWMDTN